MSGVHVVKVGGSLFDMPDLGARLRNWIAAQTGAQLLLIAGGGEFAEAIRRADERFRLGEAASHWLCVEALGLSARLLLQLVPDFAFVDRWSAISQDSLFHGAKSIVFDCREFLREIEPKLAGRALPASWQTTSDSIAARVARALSAERLTLLKSAAPPTENLEKLSALGYVDSHFPVAVQGLANVHFVNLR